MVSIKMPDGPAVGRTFCSVPFVAGLVYDSNSVSTLLECIFISIVLRHC